MQINRYRRFSAAAMQPDLEKVQKATVLSDLDAIVDAQAAFGEYVFTAVDALTKRFNQAERVEITTFETSNGTLLNRANVIEKSGKKVLMRCYGTKGSEFPACELKADQIKKIAVGFCESDGKKVTDTQFNPVTGEAREIPILYLDLRPLMK